MKVLNGKFSVPDRFNFRVADHSSTIVGLIRFERPHDKVRPSLFDRVIDLVGHRNLRFRSVSGFDMERRPNQISPSIRTKLAKARVARFATLDAESRPHLVPVCFAYDGSAFYTAIDKKQKRLAPEKLARVRHIKVRPRVALLIDEYYEEWTRLWYVLVRGTAKLIPKSATRERNKVIRQLRKKYPQYAAGMLSDDAPIIRITPQRIAFWGKF